MPDPLLREVVYIACLVAAFVAGLLSGRGGCAAELLALREQIDRLAALERSQRRTVRELLARARALPQHAHGAEEGEHGGEGG